MNDHQSLALTSSAANFRTAVKGVASGTLSTLKGSLGSEVSVILKVTFVEAAAVESPPEAPAGSDIISENSTCVE